MPKAPKPKPSPLSNIDDATAQQDLNAEMFPHYILGRCLALEEMVKELWKALPAKKREEIAARIQADADAELSMVTDEFNDGCEDVKRHVTRCGFVHVLVTQTPTDRKEV
jgi:hypothetical protein